jgi:hypothetical protein
MAVFEIRMTQKTVWHGRLLNFDTIDYSTQKAAQ